jgi:hypothetical protein
MDLSSSLSSAIDNIIAEYKASRVDGKLTFNEMLTLVYNASATFIKLVETVKPGPNATKKEIVLAAIAQFYDVVVAPIDIAGVPNLLEGPIDSVLRSLVLSLASAWIDAIVNIFNKIGWGVDTVDGVGKLQAPLIF